MSLLELELELLSRVDSAKPDQVPVTQITTDSHDYSWRNIVKLVGVLMMKPPASSLTCWEVV